MHLKKACFAALSLLSQVAPAGTPPALDLTLKPQSGANGIESLDIELRVVDPNVAAGKTLLRMPLIIVSAPTVRYDGDAIHASDARGPLVLTATDEAPTPQGIYRHWTADRDTVGPVTARYRAYPRKVDENTRNGPLFDLRSEAGGFNGAGISFLALPDTKEPYSVHLKWDMSAAPPSTRGVWSLGEGNVDTVLPAETLAFSYYALGPLKSFPPPNAGENGFTMYWLSDPPFDTVALAEGIQKFYGFAANFFHDEGGSYRVFIRRNPYRGGGGTALAKSFMFGYGLGKSAKLEDLQTLLAHEMTHNWPRIDGEHGDTAWYTEGMAEYYSLVFLRRTGIFDDAAFLREINERAAGYYTNPYRSLTNPQAAEKFWTDSEAQRVPYGRGFMYLARVDAQLQAKSKGSRSLDDLVREVHDRQEKGENIGVPEWIAIVKRELGPDAGREYADMVAGKRIVPPDNAFGPCLTPAPAPVRPFELGFDSMHMSVVHDLKPGSAAAKAGLREGDVLLEAPELDQLRKDPTLEVVAKIKRGDETREIRYLPRSAPIEGYQWIRNAPPNARCRS